MHWTWTDPYNLSRRLRDWRRHPSAAQSPSHINTRKEHPGSRKPSCYASEFTDESKGSFSTQWNSSSPTKGRIDVSKYSTAFFAMRSESSLSSTSSEVDNESNSSQSSIKTSSSVRSLEGTAEAFQHVRLQSSQDLNRKLSRGVKIGNQTKAHVVTKLSLPSVGWSSESDSDLPQYIDPAVLWPEQVGKWRLTSEDGDDEKPIERLEGYSDVEQQSSEDISDVSSDDGESELEDSDVSSDASEEEQEVNDPSPTRSVVKKTLPRRAKRTRAESLEEDENSTEASSDEDRDEDYKDDDYGQSYADNKPLRRLRPLVRRAASHVSLSGDDGDDNELRRKRVRTSGRFKDPSSLDIDYSSDVDKPFQEAVKVDCSHCSSRNQHQVKIPRNAKTTVYNEIADDFRLVLDPIQCPIPGCNGTMIIPEKCPMQRHLKKCHGSSHPTLVAILLSKKDKKVRCPWVHTDGRSCRHMSGPNDIGRHIVSVHIKCISYHCPIHHKDVHGRDNSSFGRHLKNPEKGACVKNQGPRKC